MVLFAARYLLFVWRLLSFVVFCFLVSVCLLPSSNAELARFMMFRSRVEQETIEWVAGKTLHVTFV